MPRQTIKTYYITQENIHAPKRSHLWIEGDIKSFVMCDDMLLDYYTEPFMGRPPLLELVHLGAYMKQVRYMWKGVAYSVREWAAAHGMDKDVYIRIIDRLEDVELLHRVLCIDVRSHPYDLAMHTARQIERLRRDHKRLSERVTSKATAAARTQARKEKTQWPTETIDLTARLAKIAQMEHEIKVKQIQEVIRHVTESNVGATKPLSSKQFMERVRAICKERRLPYNDKILREAMDAVAEGR